MRGLLIYTGTIALKNDTGKTNILNRYRKQISLLYTGIHFKEKYIPVWTNEFLDQLFEYTNCKKFKDPYYYFISVLCTG